VTAQGERVETLGTRPAEAAGRRAVTDALGALSTLVPIGIFAADSAGTCWYVNQRLIDFLRAEVGTSDDPPLHLEMSADRPTLWLTSTPEAPEPVRLALQLRVMPLMRPSANGSAASSGPDGSPDYLGLVVDASSEADSARILHPNERLIDALVERSPEVITVLEADGRWRFSNASAWRLFGYQPGFDPAGGLLSLIHPDDVEIALDALARTQAGEDLSDKPIETRVRASDGSWRFIETTVDNLVEDPTVQGLLLRSRDVTEARQTRIDLEAANERLSALIRGLHLAVLLEDADRNVLLTNEAFVTLFEVPYPPEQLSGRPMTSLTPDFYRRFGDPTAIRASTEHVQQLIRGRQPAIGERIVLHDGRVLERDFIPVVVAGVYRGHLWLFRDISTQAQAEADWESLIEAQRRENHRLVELDQMKAAFLAEISHELRTPLTSILSFAELLSDGLGLDDVAEQAEFIDIIRRNADRLLRLVDDLLLLDRIETGAMPLEWGVVDVASLVSSCVASLAPTAEAKSIALEAEIGEGPKVPGDPQRVAQVLDVLLSNAIKFTPTHGRVRVRATPVERLWRIDVIDTGIGIPAREVGSIFERFFRGTNAQTSRIPGSGLGLSVARAICHLHGGNITIRSAEGTGTTVSVTIPYDRSLVDPSELADPTDLADPSELARADNEGTDA
jgi:PAS domain S-box-containing protein